MTTTAMIKLPAHRRAPVIITELIQVWIIITRVFAPITAAVTSPIRLTITANVVFAQTVVVVI